MSSHRLEPRVTPAALEDLEEALLDMSPVSDLTALSRNRLHLQITPAALEDLEEGLLGWLTQYGDDYFDGFARSVIEDFDRICEDPTPPWSDPIDEEGTLDDSCWRDMIYYRVTTEAVLVLRVLHQYFEEYPDVRPEFSPPIKLKASPRDHPYLFHRAPVPSPP